MKFSLCWKRTLYLWRKPYNWYPCQHSPCRSRISMFSAQHHTNPAGNRCTACMPHNIVWMPVHSPHTFRIISPPISVLHLPFSFSHPSIHSFRRRRRWYPTTSEQHQQPPSNNAIALPIPVQSYVLSICIVCWCRRILSAKFQSNTPNKAKYSRAPLSFALATTKRRDSPSSVSVCHSCLLSCVLNCTAN